VLKKIASTSQTWPILWAYDDMANKEYFKWFVKLELASSIKIKNGIRLYNQDVQILFRILHNNKKIEADFSTTDAKTWLNSVYKYLANEKWVQNELIDPESQLSRIVRVELEYAKRNIQSKARSRAKKYDSQIRYSKRTTRHNNALQRVENERFLCVVASEPDSFKLILRALERYIRARSSSKI
jgi:hypothetical protein